MEKLLAYIVLLILILVWVAIYEVYPAFQGLLIIISICGVALGGCCRRTREGR